MMIGLRTIVAAAGLAVLVAGALSPPEARAQSPGPALAPAQFKPLPVGTRVDYDTWSYRVAASDGFDVTYKVGNSWAYQYAVFGKSGDGVYDVGWDWTAILDGDARAALETLWPLKVGKKIRLKITEESLLNSLQWEIAIEVTGTEVLDLNGVRYATYVVREQAITDGVSNWRAPDTFEPDTFDTEAGEGEAGEGEGDVRSDAKYVATHWYHPNSGLVLKSIKKWIEGYSQGDQEEYELVHVRYFVIKDSFF